MASDVVPARLVLPRSAPPLMAALIESVESADSAESADPTESAESAESTDSAEPRQLRMTIDRVHAKLFFKAEANLRSRGWAYGVLTRSQTASDALLSRCFLAAPSLLAALIESAGSAEAVECAEAAECAESTAASAI